MLKLLALLMTVAVSAPAFAIDGLTEETVQACLAKVKNNYTQALKQRYPEIKVVSILTKSYKLDSNRDILSLSFDATAVDTRITQKYSADMTVYNVSAGDGCQSYLYIPVRD